MSQIGIVQNRNRAKNELGLIAMDLTLTKWRKEIKISRMKYSSVICLLVINIPSTRCNGPSYQILWTNYGPESMAHIAVDWVNMNFCFSRELGETALTITDRD